MTNSFLTDWLLPIALASIMFGIGLSLTIGDFTRLLKRPAAIALGLAGQLVFMPLLAIVIIWGLNLPPSMAMGAILLAACPGGTMSNLMSQLLKADIALSVTLTACSTIACIFTTPFIIELGYTLFASDEATAFSIPSVMSSLILMALVPVCAGMLLRHSNGALAKRIEPGFQRFSFIFLCLLVIAMITKEWALLMDSGLLLISAAILLSLASTSTGWVLGRLSRCNAAVTATLGIEVGIQNAALAMVIALSVLHQEAYAIFPGLYGIIMYLFPAVVALIVQRQTQSPRRPAPAQDSAG